MDWIVDLTCCLVDLLTDLLTCTDLLTNLMTC
jgi:hypothetical protein